MTPTERDVLIRTCVAAACADGHLGQDERHRIARLAEEISPRDHPPADPGVLAQPVTPEELAAAVTDPATRRTAYQLAAVVCLADGVLTEPERRHLAALRAALGLSEAAARGLEAEAERYVDPGLPPVSAAGPAAGAPGDADRRILRYAILAGAAELLPQAAATMVVLPLQLKLVYDIGARHGVTQDARQIRELAAVFGIGATTQVVESLARRVLGGAARGVGGRVLGGLLGGAAGAAAGGLFSFSTTYALGHAAEDYYARGRRLTEADLRGLFDRFREDAKTIFPKVESEIREQADRLDPQSLLATVRDLA